MRDIVCGGVCACAPVQVSGFSANSCARRFREHVKGHYDDCLHLAIRPAFPCVPLEEVARHENTINEYTNTGDGDGGEEMPTKASAFRLMNNLLQNERRANDMLMNQGKQIRINSTFGWDDTPFR